MPKPVPEEELKAIEVVLKAHPDGISRIFIGEALSKKVSPRTLQSHLRYLVKNGRVMAEGQGRAVKYRPAGATVAVAAAEVEIMPLSKEAKEIQQIVLQLLPKRTIVGYNRGFLDSYRPNETAYLTNAESARLHEIGTVAIGSQPAGTYARKIIDRLLIDLSWNSSRLCKAPTTGNKPLSIWRNGVQRIFHSVNARNSLRRQKTRFLHCMREILRVTESALLSSLHGGKFGIKGRRFTNACGTAAG